MTFVKNIFSAEPINKGRQPELDIAKAVIVFFLAFIHCTIECTPEEGLVSGIPYLFDTVIGGPLSAPVFMFAMGAGMIYTKNNTAVTYVKRGFRIAATGFVLNICRYTVPALIGYAITSDYANYIEPIMYRTLCNDMLQFAGTAMMLIGFLQWIKAPDFIMLIMSFGMSLCGMFLNDTDVDNSVGNILLGFLIGTEDKAGMVLSDFPLLNWFIVPVAGNIFGKFLIRVKEKDRFYLTVSPVCLVVTAVYFIIGIKNRAGMFGEGQNCYYHITTNDVLISITGVMAVLGVYYFAAKLIPDNFMKRIMGLSKNVTSIYCIHWVVIALTVNVGLYAVKGTQELSVPVTLLLAFLTSIASIIIAHFWSERKQNRNIRKEQP